MTDVRFDIAATNGSAKRRILATFPGGEYRGECDVTDESSLRQFFSVLAEQAGCDADALCDQYRLDVTRKSLVAEQQVALLAGPDAHRSREISYERITAKEFAKGEYKLEFVIKDVLVDLQPMVLAAARKTLKTSVSCDLALSVVTGHPFLGQFEVENARRVAFMSGESGLATLQDTMLRVAESKQMNLEDAEGLIVSSDLPTISCPWHRNALRKFLENDEIGVVIIDPMYLCMDGSEAGNLFAMGQMLRPLAETCKEVGATPILVHHTRKTNVEQFQPPELEHIAYAGFQEFARQWLLLGRRELYQPGSGDHRLWLSIGGSAGHGSLWGLDVSEGVYPNRRWDVKLLSCQRIREEREEQKRDARAARQAETQAENCRRLREALRQCPDGDTAKRLRDIAGLNASAFSTAIQTLLQEERAESCMVKKGNNREYEAYKPTTRT